VAEELGVRYVLEGSVQKSGDRVRITAQLVDAITGKHLWAHRYDRELKDIFAIQDEITREVVAELAVKLVGGEIERIRSGTQNLEAWTYFRKAIKQLRRFDMEGFLKARDLSKKVIELDPDFPGGYYMLCWTYALTVRMGWSKSPREDLKRAEELVNKCLAMNDSDPHAHNLLGFIYLGRRQYDKAIKQGQRAVSLAPSIADSHAYLADSLRLAGRAEEAIGEMTKAMRLAPFYPTWYLWTLGSSYYLEGRFEEAIAAFKESQKRRPHLMNPLMMAVIYSAWEREKQARAEAEEVLRIMPTYSLERFRKGLPYKDPAIVERILTFARKAGLPDKPPLPLPDKPSIAVLPFTNMSDDPKQEYFSDGITEEIITALSKIPKLFVIARNSTFTYKGKPTKVQQVSRELGVKYVLEGSVRKAGDKVRVTAQLVDAKTGNHLWAERYDRELKDIFALQDEITMKIITALQVELTEGEQARLLAKGTDNLEAYLKLLQGREHVYRQNKEDNALAKQLLQEAIALDPEYPKPYAFLSTTHMLDMWLGSSKSPRESLAQAIELAEKAIVLDDSYATAHGLLGNLYIMTRQYDKGIAECERGVALDPNSAGALGWLGRSLYWADRPEEAIPVLEKAIRLNPITPGWYLYSLAMAFRDMGRYEEAISACKKVLHREPKNVIARLVLAATYSLSGREEEARAETAEILRIDPNYSLDRLAKTRSHKNQANTNSFIDALRKAGLPE
jgi:TolB-like protein/Tfp pilus assembly protein PilF